jgi:hypothetical protein
VEGNARDLKSDKKIAEEADNQTGGNRRIDQKVLRTRAAE